MINYQIEGKEFKMSNSWAEINLDKMIKIASLKPSDDASDISNVMSTISILSECEPEELSDLSMSLFYELASKLEFLKEDCPAEDKEVFVINGTNYTFKKDLNELTWGEYSSIKILQKQIEDDNKDVWEYAPIILSVLLRPSKEVMNNETGASKWIQDKFDSSDLEYRKELFRNNLKLPEINRFIRDFMFGKTS